MLVTVVAFFAGYQDVGQVVALFAVINMLVTVVALFACYRDVGDGCCIVCRLSRCW